MSQSGINIYSYDKLSDLLGTKTNHVIGDVAFCVEDRRYYSFHDKDENGNPLEGGDRWVPLEDDINDVLTFPTIEIRDNYDTSLLKAGQLCYVTNQIYTHKSGDIEYSTGTFYFLHKSQSVATWVPFPYSTKESIIDVVDERNEELIKSIFNEIKVGLPKPAEQVQADWNETDTTSKSFIKSKPTIPTKETVKDWGFGTVNKVKMNGVSLDTSSGTVDLGTVITSHQDISHKVDSIEGKGLSTNDFTNEYKSKIDKLSVVAESGSYNDLKDKPEIPVVPDLATVATSGSYNDLKDKPEIPNEVNEQTVEAWGFTKNQGDYNKPESGIPFEHLSTLVQKSLQKADTALQTYEEQYTGTVDSIKLNGETLTPIDGTIDLGTVIVEVPEVTELSEQVEELKSKVDNLTPNECENYVTDSELEEKLNTINDSLDDKVNKDTYEAQITSIQKNQQATDKNLEDYKGEVEKTYSTKEELGEAVKPLATKTQVASDIEKAKNEAIGATTTTITDGLSAVRQEMSNNYTTKVETGEISSQIEDIQEKQSGFETELESQKESIEAIDGKVGEVNSKLDESIEGLDKKIDQVKVDILMEPNVYIPSKDIKDEAVISIDVPHYKGMSRKDIADASGVLYTEMFDNILFTRVNPQIVEPSAKMIYAENNTYFTEDEIKGNVEILREVNTEAPDESKFGFIAEQGKVIYADKETTYAGEPVTNQNPEGVANISNLVCTVNGEELESEPGVISLGTQEYKYRVYFHNGPKVTDNYGDEITSLWWDNKRYVDSSNSIKVYGTKSWYASTGKTEDDSLTKQPLVKWNEGGNQTVYAKLLPSCVMLQTFRIPGELKNLYIKNGGSYTLVPLAKYKPVEINGDYYTYTYDHETYGHRGAIEIKVEF